MSSEVGSPAFVPPMLVLPFASIDLPVDIYRDLITLPRASRLDRGRYMRFFLRAMSTLTKNKQIAAVAANSSEAKLGIEFEKCWRRIKLGVEVCEDRIIRIKLVGAASAGRGLFESVQFDGTPLTTKVQGKEYSADCFGVVQSYAFLDDADSSANTLLRERGRSSEHAMTRLYRTTNCTNMTKGHSDVKQFAQLELLPTCRQVLATSAMDVDSPIFTLCQYIGDGATEGVLRHYCGLRHEPAPGDSSEAEKLAARMSLWVSEECSGHGCHGAVEDGVEIFLPTEDEQEDVKTLARKFAKSNRALEDCMAEWLCARYVEAPLDEDERVEYEALVRALLDDDTADGRDLLENLCAAQLRFQDGFLYGACKVDKLGDVVDLLSRLNMKEVQFGRFGNAAASLRRCAVSVLVGFLDLGSFALQHGSRTGFLKSAFKAGFPLKKFVAAVFGVGLGLAPFERCEKRLLAHDNIKRLRDLRTLLAIDVEATRHEDWASISRWTGLDDVDRRRFVRDVGRAIDAAGASMEAFPFRRLFCAPYSLLLHDDEFNLDKFLGRVAAADVDSLDAGFTLKIREVVDSSPALLETAARSLEDVCLLLLTAPTAIYFCERAHKFSSRGHKGVASFTVVNETAWCEKFLQNNRMRAPDLDAAPRGPVTLSEAWKKSGASSVRTNTLFFGDKAAKGCSLEAQKSVLIESHKTYAAAMLAQPQQLEDLRVRVEERRVELRSRAAEKLAKTLLGVDRLEQKKCDLVAHYLAVNTENIDDHITHRSFHDTLQMFDGKKGLDAAGAAVQQRELTDEQLQDLATRAEQYSYFLPYFSLPDLDFRVTELIRRSRAKEEVCGGLLFVRPRRQDGFLVSSGFQAFQLALAVHQPYHLSASRVEIIVDENGEGTTFWKQGEYHTLTVFAADTDLFFLPPSRLHTLSAACECVRGAVTEHNLLFVPGIQKLSLGKTFERRKKAAEESCQRKRVEGIRKHINCGRKLEVNAEGARLADLENYEEVAQKAREELQQVREAAEQSTKNNEEDSGHLVDPQCRAFPRGSGWTMVNKNMNVDVWRCQIVNKTVAARYKSLGLFSMKDCSVTVWGGEEHARTHALLLRRIVKWSVAHGLVALSSAEQPSLHTRTCRELFQNAFGSLVQADAERLKARGHFFSHQRNVFFDDLNKLGSSAVYDTEKMALP